MAACQADADHCCWLGDGPCSLLRDDGSSDAERRWVCTLREELGSWDAVHVDARYLSRVRPRLDAIGVAVDCGDWPPPGKRCATCGVTGG